MGFKIRFEDQDYAGESGDCTPTTLPNVFTDANKNEIVIVLYNQAVVISL